MNRSDTVELLLLRGQIMRTRDPAIRGELQHRFDEGLAALKRKGAALPSDIRAETARSHPLYRRLRA